MSAEPPVGGETMIEEVLKKRKCRLEVLSSYSAIGK
jgi:hypothetical protein